MAEYIVPAGIIVGAAAAVIGAGVAGYSAYRQYKQEERQAKGIAEEKQIEADIARENAAFEAQQHRRRIAFLLGEQRAQFSALGVDPSSGTPLINEIDLVTQGELEALSIKRTGSLTSRSRILEGGIARYRGQLASGAIAPTVAGYAIQGVGSAAAGAANYYRPTTSQVKG